MAALTEQRIGLRYAALTASLVATGCIASLHTALGNIVAVVLSAVAMGLQSGLARNGKEITTTFVSGAFEHAVDDIRRFSTRQFSASGAVWAAYLCGSVCFGLLSLAHVPLPLEWFLAAVIPCALLLRAHRCA